MESSQLHAKYKTWFAGTGSKTFGEVARDLRIPLKRVHLPSEAYVRSLWERDTALVRPDGFVSWRSDDLPTETLSGDVIRRILLVSVGQQTAGASKESRSAKAMAFTSSIGNVDQEAGKFEKMAVFQTEEDVSVSI
ncbi:hypothetical protein F5884DRAFT_759051 [Xylogone sp. PMI_703]|nr:hypothetical protein F5884DRAFT_759051 [Xylogone sp. PMI_703]